MDVVLTAVDFSLVSFFATTMLLPLFANMCSVFADWCEVSTHLLIVSLPLVSCSLHYFLPAVPLDRDSYWKMMNKYIGSDVMSVITLLIIIFEPLGKWQRFVLMDYALKFPSIPCWNV
ncbi:uncharacterized protein LOC125527605 [Triticum urartu]|uniref:uncharacterized protein LOC125527605 n=1 Tax=Triticum urartu TaxID=4572 RepID=UPI0020443B9A|nr:uncharacterized protein LOC125527605 [Triticum urartu]